jgi:lycopene beta-cyclase
MPNPSAMPPDLPATDVIVIGSGPAATLLAGHLAAHGVRVTGIAPGGGSAPWANTFGIWEDELIPFGLERLLRYRLTDCRSVVAGREVRHNRVYGLLDNGRLQAHWLEQAAGVTWVDDRVVALAHAAAWSVVTTASGGQRRARLVIDATGHVDGFLQRPQQAGVAYQAAWGVIGRFSAPPIPPGRFVLMDYRDDHLSPTERRDGPATFLYGMALEDGRHFVEETSLAAAPAVPFGLLEERLHRRLRSQGIALLEALEVERVLFPMNRPMPHRDQPVFGFGANAGLVHPATGYQLGNALRRAEPVAAAIAGALRTPLASPQRVAQAAWQALWPPMALRKHWLYLFGLQTVLRFSPRQLNAFFATFFSLPDPEWSGYLSNTLEMAPFLRSMSRLFLRAPLTVRQRMARTALTPAAWRGVSSAKY